MGGNLRLAVDHVGETLSEFPTILGRMTLEQYVSTDITLDQILTGLVPAILEELFEGHHFHEFGLIPGLMTKAIKAKKDGHELLHI